MSEPSKLSRDADHAAATDPRQSNQEPASIESRKTTMNYALAAASLALVLLAPTADAYAVSRTPAPVVRDHRTTPVVRDHRTNVRDHRKGGEAGGGVTVTKTPGAKRRPACVNNVCRDVTR
jgi:hypothetical protein